MQAEETAAQVPSTEPAIMPPVPLHLQNSQNRWVRKNKLCGNWIVLVHIRMRGGDERMGQMCDIEKNLFFILTVDYWLKRSVDATQFLPSNVCIFVENLFKRRTY